MKCAAIDPRTFFRHQSKYLEPAISLVWFQHQSELIESLKDKSLTLGDARADSPGHSAKYSSYSVFDLENKTVIDIQLVQVNCMTVFLMHVYRERVAIIWKRRALSDQFSSLK